MRALVSFLTLLTLSLTLVPVADAGPRDRTERRQNTREAADNRRDTRNDLADLARLDSIIDDWEAARRNGNRTAEANADQRIAAWVRQELSENKRDVAESRREVARSQSEVDASRRERNRTTGTGRPLAAADDRRDLRDDRRDRADDRQDLAKDRADRASTRAIAVALRDLQPAFDAGDASASQYARKSNLLADLKGLAAAEVHRNAAENREDARERREDRRERFE